MYTSGTTGNPKGVMLTHGNILSNVVACLEACPLAPDDVLLSWLPLSHIYARTVDHYAEPHRGASHLALAESAETVVANLAEMQPTHMSARAALLREGADAGRLARSGGHGAKRLRTIFGPRIN